MVQDYLVHHDQANQNLTNELLDEIHLSNKNEFLFKIKLKYLLIDLLIQISVVYNTHHCFSDTNVTFKSTSSNNNSLSLS